MGELSLPYRHRQSGTLMRAVLAAVIAGVVLMGWMAAGDSAALATTGLVAGLLVITLWLFSSLTVEVDHDQLRLWFGPGFIHRTFPVHEIDRCQVVRNRWYYGWGIRLTPGGWLFNVSGLDAVQLTMRSGRRYRIGTDEPRRLLAAIHVALGVGGEHDG